MIVLKCLLHRMQLAVLRETLDRSDMRALARRRKRRAGLDSPSIHMNDAGSALRSVATDVRARQAQLLTYELNQQGARIDIRRDRLAVYRHGYLNHQLPPRRTLGRCADAPSPNSISVPNIPAAPDSGLNALRVRQPLERRENRPNFVVKVTCYDATVKRIDQPPVFDILRAVGPQVSCAKVQPVAPGL
jgi:hypothetical protein